MKLSSNGLKTFIGSELQVATSFVTRQMFWINFFLFNV